MIGFSTCKRYGVESAYEPCCLPDRSGHQCLGVLQLSKSKQTIVDEAYEANAILNKMPHSKTIDSKDVSH